MNCAVKPAPSNEWVDRFAPEGNQPEVAKRNPVPYRYDLLVWDFIKGMALMGNLGAKVYGDRNWQKSKLEGDKSPMNHMAEHYRAYMAGEVHDHFGDRKSQLVAIAFNAMMEWYWESNAKD